MTPVQIRRLILVVVAVGLIVVEEVVGFNAGALAEPWSLTRTIVHMFAGITYAVCAWLAWQSADSPVPGRIMILIAFIWFPPPFVAATWQFGVVWPLLEAVGLFWALLQAVLVAVYPTGRLQGALEKGVIIVGAAASLVRMLTVLFVAPVPVEGCDCAQNSFVIFPSSAVFDIVDKGFRVLGLLLIIVIIVSVAVRWARGTTPARHIAFIMPIALILWCSAGIYETVAVSFGLGGSSAPVYLGYLGTATIPIGFVTGLIYIRSLRGRVSDLMVLTRDGVDREYWQGMLADTLRDPRLRVYWWEAASGTYRDAAGVRLDDAADPTHARNRTLMEIDSPDGRLAVIDHDVALKENSELLTAVATALRLSVDNGRLRNELENTLQEVRESRVRIIEAGIIARRKIERDLHDGSQQSLVSVALSLRMAIGRARSAGQDELADDLEAALQQLTDALKQLRELARGIHPSSLIVGGLGMAIGELTGRSPVPVQVEVTLTDRLPPLAEATVYFFVAECLTNIAKYADAATAKVSLTRAESGLVVSVSDDGRGGAGFDSGTGLIGLVDRFEALGGTVELESTPGAGTTVTAFIPPAALE
jgi:signal transduction histidine kinase